MKNKWIVLFSYPEDFENISSVEILGILKYWNDFERLNCIPIGISIDSVKCHLEWFKKIYRYSDIRNKIIIIEDRIGEIIRKYGMISKEISNCKPIRSVRIIDDNGIIRAVLNYPVEVCRNVIEILRIVEELQNI